MVLSGLLAAVIAALVAGAGPAGGASPNPGYIVTLSWTLPSSGSPPWSALTFHGHMSRFGYDDSNAHVYVYRFNSPQCTGPESAFIGGADTDANGDYTFDVPPLFLNGPSEYMQASGYEWGPYHDYKEFKDVSPCLRFSRTAEVGGGSPTYLELNWGTGGVYRSAVFQDTRFYGVFRFESPFPPSPYDREVVGVRGYSSPDCSGPARWISGGTLDDADHYAITPPRELFSGGPIAYVQALGYFNSLVATSRCLAVTPPDSMFNHEFLCYSKWQVQPSVWPWHEAVTLLRQGYWLPTALDGNIEGGTNLGKYNLQCNVTPKGDGYVGGSGEWYGGDWSAYAALNGGMYPH